MNNVHNIDELPGLSEENHQYLRDVAKEAVLRHVNSQPQQKLIYESQALKNNWGVFVTLRIKGNLRGCIGNLRSTLSLPETIAEMAVKSASIDPRFPPLGPAELEHLEFDISILGPMMDVKDITDIKIGRDGLVIEMGGRHGLLLPQVATDHGLDVESFLNQTCIKAGLPTDAWRQGAKIFRFAAEVF